VIFTVGKLTPHRECATQVKDDNQRVELFGSNLGPGYTVWFDDSPIFTELEYVMRGGQRAPCMKLRRGRIGLNLLPFTLADRPNTFCATSTRK
jgi:hypothetical protein